MRNESHPVRGALSRLAWLGVTGFLLNGNWEWLQTPFFADSSSTLNEIVWFRLHCTLGDVLILMACAGGVTAVRRSARWLAGPGFLDLALLTLFGVVYTVFSENRNLSRGAWEYSDLMPIVPGTSVGVVPLVQWLVLPTLAVVLASRLARSRDS
jgi:hypothetical protein